MCLSVRPSVCTGKRNGSTIRKISKKIIIKKTYDDKTDILEWQNIPTKDMQSSPVHRLMARRTISLVPMTQDLIIQ